MDLVELPPDTTPLPTAVPRSTVPIRLRAGYDRNVNKILDPDEGIRGLTVYVTDDQGQILGQGLTDGSGAVLITVRVAPDAALIVSIPYFAAAQQITAQNPTTQPVIITGAAQIPAVLP